MKDPYEVFTLKSTRAEAMERVARTLITYGYQGPESVVDLSRQIVDDLQTL